MSRWSVAIFYLSCVLAVSLIWGFATLRLGIEGEVTAVRLFRVAQKWQTFGASLIAIIVSLIAYSGARLAYKGAMAKVDYDREIDDFTRDQEVLGLFLRVRGDARSLHHKAQYVAAALSASSVDGVTATEELDVRVSGSDFDEAWKRLQYFPVAIATMIEEERRFVETAIKLYSFLPNGVTIVRANNFVPGDLKEANAHTVVKAYRDQCGQVALRAARIIDELSKQIDEITREAD